MRNIKLTIEYDGTRYQGWQQSGSQSDSSSNKKGASGTISGRISEVLYRMTGEDLELFCSARTEAGVHASGQIANFKTETSLSTEEIRRYLNHYLPLDIVILSAEEVPERFHAGLNVQSVTYVCHIVTGPVMDVFNRNYALYLPQYPDINRMNQAAAALLGKHDFRNFSSGKKKKASEKTLFSIQISEESNGVIQILLEGNNFLHQMPRMIISTLLDIGCGKRDVDCIGHIFNGTECPSPPCPPCGLTLTEILLKPCPK